MNRFKVIATAMLALTWLADGESHAAEPAKLNLLFITADDMNADSSGWMGCPLATTPNLDALAKASDRFVNHHVTCPICQPGRSVMLTGRVPHRNGALGFDPIDRGTPTLVEVLNRAGYFTATINKTAHMQPRDKFDWTRTFDGSGKNPKLFRRQIDECLAAAAEAKQPFFINAAITDPHRPFVGSQQGAQRKAKKSAKKKKQNSQAAAEEGQVEPFQPDEVTVPSFLEDLPAVRREITEYYTSVRRFDVTLGEVLAALKASGQNDRTIVVFLSDHGMSFPFSKATAYRNGTWSPVVLRYPGMQQPRVFEEMVSSVDLMPTLLDLLGLPHPEGMDGRSWQPLLRGESQPGRDHVFTHVNTVSSGHSFAQRCLRTRSRSLQFHAWSDGETRFRVEAMNGLTYSAMAEAAQSDPRVAARVRQFVVGIPLALYDLEKDPDERRNVIDDPAYAADRQRLMKLLLAHLQETGDPQLEAFRQAQCRAETQTER